LLIWKLKKKIMRLNDFCAFPFYRFELIPQVPVGDATIVAIASRFGGFRIKKIHLVPIASKKWAI